MHRELPAGDTYKRATDWLAQDVQNGREIGWGRTRRQALAHLERLIGIAASSPLRRRASMSEAHTMVKVKEPSHNDLAALMDTGDRETPGVTVSQHRAKAKRPLPFTDRRRNNGPRRTEQCNVRLTMEMMNEMKDLQDVHDLTLVELIERAVRHYIAAVRAGDVDAGLEGA